MGAQFMDPFHAAILTEFLGLNRQDFIDFLYTNHTNDEQEAESMADAVVEDLEILPNS